MVKFDPHGSTDSLNRWLVNNKHGVDGLNPENSSLLLEHVQDLRTGHLGAPSAKKGPRSDIRVFSVASRLSSYCRMLQAYFGQDKTFYSLSRRDAVTFFGDLRAGRIRNKRGRVPKDVDSISKTAQAWFRWYIRREASEGRVPPADPFLDVSKSTNTKPAWVYLDEAQLKRLADACSPKYRAALLLLWDSGCRAPTELVNIRVKDISYSEDGGYNLTIRGETSKTFGRTIRLLFSGPTVLEFAENNKLGPDDYLFGSPSTRITSEAGAKYYRRLATKLFGEVETAGREKTSKLSLYDFRHCAACYWLPRYKNQSALLYRFGWKKPEMAHYYSEFMGMKDTVRDEDLVIAVAASELEKSVARERAKREQVEEELASMKARMEEFQKRLELLSLASQLGMSTGQTDNFSSCSSRAGLNSVQLPRDLNAEKFPVENRKG